MITEEEKNKLIIRQSCIKAAAELYSVQQGGTEAVIKAAEEFEKHVIKDTSLDPSNKKIPEEKVDLNPNKSSTPKAPGQAEIGVAWLKDHGGVDAKLGSDKDYIKFKSEEDFNNWASDKQLTVKPNKFYEAGGNRPKWRICQ